MSETTQTIIVAMVVGSLMIYSSYRAYKTLTQKHQDAAGKCIMGCDGCKAKSKTNCRKETF